MKGHTGSHSSFCSLEFPLNLNSKESEPTQISLPGPSQVGLNKIKQGTLRDCALIYSVAFDKPLASLILPFLFGYRRASYTCPSGLGRGFSEGVAGKCLAWGLAPWKGPSKAVVCEAGVLVGRDREGITSFDSQMDLNIRVQISYFQG